MNDHNKTKKQLIDELAELKRKASECERLEAGRRHEEAMVREGEIRYQSIFEHSHDAIMMTLPNGQVLAANPKACSTIGYTEAEIKQLGRAGIVDPADRRLPPALKERAQTGKFKGELTFIRRDGSKIEVEVSSAIYRDETGFDRTVTIFNDITERKHAEKVLRESEARFSTIFNASPAAIAITRLKDGKLVNVNDAWQKITGFARKEAIGHTPIELNIWVNPGERDRLMSKLSRSGHGARFRISSPA